MKRLTYGSLFSGIGGIDRGFDRAGMVCKWQCEIDEYATKVLERHWPDLRRWRDIGDFIADAEKFSEREQANQTGKTQAERGRSAGPRLSETSGGLLNPRFVSLIMGFPADWCETEPACCDASETPSSPPWESSSGDES